MSSVDAWTWSLTADVDLEPLLAMLCSAERDRASRFRSASDRKAYVLAHAGMRVLLAQRLQCVPGTLEFARAPGGKPFLPVAGALRFNLSHSREHALLAMGACELGVDIEAHAAIDALPELLAQVATRTERATIEALPDATEQRLAFFRLWVRKEALLKAIGSGLPGGADRHEVGCSPWSDGSWTPVGRGMQSTAPWIGCHLPAPPQHVAAIVIAQVAAAAPSLRHHFLPRHWLAAPQLPVSVDSSHITLIPRTARKDFTHGPSERGH